MFLLTSDSLRRERELQKALPVFKEGDSPEPDALRAIEKLEALFLPNFSRNKLSYDTEASIKTPLSSGEHLRALGGATSRMRQARMNPGHYHEGSWLIDGLARELLRELLADVTIRTAPASAMSRSTTQVNFDELMDLLSNSIQWNFTRSKPGLSRDREYLITADGINERLIFQGNSVGMSLSTRMISGVKMTGRGRPRSLAGGNLKRAVNRIFEDQNRRIGLSFEYERVPEALGFPAQLRAEIKRSLETAGIPNGSYSREGFSSGKFLYRYTRAEIKDSSSELLFRRCSYCRSVQSLSANGGSYDETQAVWKLTENHIGPWHRSICNRSSGGEGRGFENMPWEIDWMARGF